jgi:hypothetical protein
MIFKNKKMYTSKISNFFKNKNSYDFFKISILLLNIILIIITSLILFYLILNNKVSINSIRLYYFFYIILLTIISLLFLFFDKYKKISQIILILAFIELFLGLTTYWGYKKNILRNNLFPPNIEYTNNIFEYHPLLQGVLKKNFNSNSKIKISHNKFGLRGDEIIINNKNILINIYGGSTTYNTGIENKFTWTNYLQTFLGEKFIIANFGVPGYSSAEHIIQTAFYSNILGFYPKCSLYYVGWNDIRSASIKNIDNAYADFHLVSQIDNLRVRKINNESFSPLFLLVSKNLSLIFDTIPYSTTNLNRTNISTEIMNNRKHEEIYKKNIRTIIALNLSQNSKTIFVPQILNYEIKNHEEKAGWVMGLTNKEVLNLQDKFNLILKNEATTNNAYYINLDKKKFSNKDFIDEGHFSILGSEKFAKLIFKEIKQICK